MIVPPPHVPDNPLGVATTKPTGSESVNATPVKDVLALGVRNSKGQRGCPVDPYVSYLPNVLVIAGGDITVNVAVEVFPVPPFVEVT